MASDDLADVGPDDRYTLAPTHYSYRDGEVWYVVQHGPGFCNKFRVTDYDDAGLKWLRQIEWKEESRAKNPAL